MYLYINIIILLKRKLNSKSRDKQLIEIDKKKNVLVIDLKVKTKYMLSTYIFDFQLCFNYNI